MAWRDGRRRADVAPVWAIWIERVELVIYPLEFNILVMITKIFLCLRPTSGARAAGKDKDMERTLISTVN